MANFHRSSSHAFEAEVLGKADFLSSSSDQFGRDKARK